MTACPQTLLTYRKSKDLNDPFQTSYYRSHYYKRPTVHYINRILTKNSHNHKAGDLFGVNGTSVYKRTYDAKYTGYRPEHYELSVAARNPDLNNLYGKFKKRLVKSIKADLTVTGSVYLWPKSSVEPLIVQLNSPVDDATCLSRAFGRDTVPPIPPQEPGYYKHLDPLVSTTHMTYVRFTAEQQRGVARKDIVTYYDTISVPKCLGFGPQNVPPIGPYYKRCNKTVSRSAYFTTSSAVPYKGHDTITKTDYGYARTNVITRGADGSFPATLKLTRREIFPTPAMNCTASRGCV